MKTKTKIDFKEALAIFHKSEPGMRVLGADDWGSFYTFDAVTDDTVIDEDLPPILGAGRIAVDKNTGKVFGYNIYSDMNALKKAIPIKVDE